MGSVGVVLGDSTKGGKNDKQSLNSYVMERLDEYLEFTAPYNWDTFADNDDKLDEAKLLDFDLKP